MGDDAVKSAVAAALAQGGQGQPVRLRTAKVSSVSGGIASCVLGGDASALTQVALAGHAASAGQTLVVVGQGGRWYAVGNLG